MLEKSDVSVSISLSGGNKLYAESSIKDEDKQYAFYFMKNGRIIHKSFVQDKPYMTFWLMDPGEYTVKLFVVCEDGEKVAVVSEPVSFAGLAIDMEGEVKKENIFVSVGRVLSEIWKNRDCMWRIARYDHHVKDNDSYLGKVWSVLNPLIQVGTFWLVFGIGFRRGRDVGGIPFIIWMLCGLLPWFFISAGITGGASSVYSKAMTVLKLQYPVGTVPMGNILVGFMDHIMLMGIMIVIFVCYGYFPRLSWFNLLYYMFFEVFFLTALAMVTSTLTMVARDFQKLINSLIRLLFYLTPILWTLDSMPAKYRILFKANPVFYVVEGYRDSLLYGIPFWRSWRAMLFFWGVNIVLLFIGCRLHRKFRGQFIDLL